MKLAERIARVFRLIEGRDTDHGSVAWFWALAVDRGIDVSRQALTQWVREDMCPLGRADDVEAVLRGLEEHAIVMLEEKMDGLIRGRAQT